jgi:hypothetical protein
LKERLRKTDFCVWLRIITDVKTFISHGSKDYGNELLSDLADQLELTKKELLRFVDGKMTQEEYEHILRVKGVIE